MLRQFFKDESGFSLTEILVVIVIIGILILLAMPKFTSVITRAKTTEAKTMLKHIYVLQQAYYYEHDRYSPDLNALGFEPALLITEGGDARYHIEIKQADTHGFLVSAIAVIDFDNDGNFNVWQVDQTGKVRQTVPD